MLANYLVQHGGRTLSSSKKGMCVLELGAGLGLCGLVAHRLLGAEAHTSLTDGDTAVLEQLRYNVARNSDNSSTSIDCRQLIWGHEAQIAEWKRQYGAADVILATDCLYMTQSVEPFFQTIHALLAEDGIVLYCNYCACQAPVTFIAQTAHRYGLVLVDDSDVENGTDVSGSTASNMQGHSLDKDRVYRFRRQH